MLGRFEEWLEHRLLQAKSPAVFSAGRDPSRLHALGLHSLEGCTHKPQSTDAPFAAGARSAQNLEIIDHCAASVCNWDHVVELKLDVRATLSASATVTRPDELLHIIRYRAFQWISAGAVSATRARWVAIGW